MFFAPQIFQVIGMVSRQSCSLPYISLNLVAKLPSYQAMCACMQGVKASLMSSLIINGVNLCATFIAIFAVDRCPVSTWSLGARLHAV